MTPAPQPNEGPNDADRALAELLVTQISPGGAWQAEAFRSGVALHERSKRTDCIRDPHTEIHRILEDQVQTVIAAHRASAVAEAVAELEAKIAKLESDNAVFKDALEPALAKLTEAEAARDSLSALVVRLREHLTDINEYWNGGNGSAPDACQHSCEISEQALSLVPENLSDSVVISRAEYDKLTGK